MLGPLTPTARKRHSRPDAVLCASERVCVDGTNIQPLLGHGDANGRVLSKREDLDAVNDINRDVVMDEALSCSVVANRTGAVSRRLGAARRTAQTATARWPSST